MIGLGAFLFTIVHWCIGVRYWLISHSLQLLLKNKKLWYEPQKVAYFASILMTILTLASSIFYGINNSGYGQSKLFNIKWPFLSLWLLWLIILIVAIDGLVRIRNTILD